MGKMEHSHLLLPVSEDKAERKRVLVLPVYKLDDLSV